MALIESVDRIEPARVEAAPVAIADTVAELAAAAATLGRSLHPRTAANLADLVRIMNTYYSNLIEGHDTRPRDIERALAGKLDLDENRRDLQLEAAAHVRVQEQVDRMAANGALPEPASRDFLRWLHREFYATRLKRCLALDVRTARSEWLPVYGGPSRSTRWPWAGTGRRPAPGWLTS